MTEKISANSPRERTITNIGLVMVVAIVVAEILNKANVVDLNFITSSIITRAIVMVAVGGIILLIIYSMISDNK